MKPLDPSAHILCRVCHHPKAAHMTVCGMRDCACLNFLPETPDSESCDDAVSTTWQETVIESVLDLILREEEGEVFIQTKDGRECRVRVKFEPGVGYSLKGN